MNGKDETKSRKITISIEVRKGQIFVYQRPKGEIYPMDIIIWKCNNKYPFAVLFGYDSPMDYTYYVSDGKPLYTWVHSDASFGRYKYFITVNVGSKILVFDPDVIVRPRRS